MTHIETATGFVCEIEEEAIDDIELLENLSRLDRGEVACLPDAVRQLLGEEQRKALYEHLRVNGRVSVKAVAEALGEIFAGLSSKKNS